MKTHHPVCSNFNFRYIFAANLCTNNINYCIGKTICKADVSKLPLIVGISGYDDISCASEDCFSLTIAKIFIKYVYNFINTTVSIGYNSSKSA